MKPDDLQLLEDIITEVAPRLAQTVDDLRKACHPSTWQGIAEVDASEIFRVTDELAQLATMIVSVAEVFGEEEKAQIELNAERVAALERSSTSVSAGLLKRIALQREHASGPLSDLIGELMVALIQDITE